MPLLFVGCPRDRTGSEMSQQGGQRWTNGRGGLQIVGMAVAPRSCNVPWRSCCRSGTTLSVTPTSLWAKPFSTLAARRTDRLCGRRARWLQGRVIFSDISGDLLDRCRQRATQHGLTDRCHFVLAGASDLSGIGNDEVDAVTVRSVLIYEPGESLCGFLPGAAARRSAVLFEPINRFSDPHGRGRFQGYDVGPAAELADRVMAVFAAIQPATTDPC